MKRALKMWFQILTTVAALATLTSATYAWFTTNRQVSTSTASARTGTESLTLEISSSGGSRFQNMTNAPITQVNGSDASKLLPVSTADLESFYRVIMQNKEGIAVSYENADDRVDSDTFHGTVYLKSEGAPCNVYFNGEELQLGSDAQALAAMRLGLKISNHDGSRTFVMRLDDLGSTAAAEAKTTVPAVGTVVSGISGSGAASYVSDPAVNVSDYMAQAAGNDEYTAGANELFSLDADEIASVEYWLYLEGCDEQCVNQVQNIDSDIRLAFAGVRSDVVR